MSSIETCPVCRLGLRFGPVHLRCRCPIEVEVMIGSTWGPGQLVLTGVTDYARGNTVLFALDGMTAAERLAGLLSTHARRVIRIAEVEAAMARFPAELSS